MVNLFYWNNLAHDFLYAYGFDEASGNFQTNNYGRGGIGGDAVIAQSQDGIDGVPRTVNNANFATPADGAEPRMQMYIFTGPSPDRDSSLDAGVVAHEYAHGLSTRLTGGPAYDECLDNDEQQGEGWSDIIALLMTMQGSSPADRSRGIGTYVEGDPTGGIGIRGERYDPDNNTWTYDTIASTGSSPHALGAVWAQMLWEMVWLLVDEHGFDADLARGSGGNNIATQLIVDGLKLQACSPGFVESRDAILQADAINNDGENTCLIWEAFAKRGLGVGGRSGVVRRSNRRRRELRHAGLVRRLTVGCCARRRRTGRRDRVPPERSQRHPAAAPGATISAPIPPGTAYVAGSASCVGGASGSVAGGVVNFTLGSLSPDSASTCTFAVTTSTTSFAGDCSTTTSKTASPTGRRGVTSRPGSSPTGRCSSSRVAIGWRVLMRPRWSAISIWNWSVR